MPSVPYEATEGIFLIYLAPIRVSPCMQTTAYQQLNNKEYDLAPPVSLIPYKTPVFIAYHKKIQYYYCFINIL